MGHSRTGAMIMKKPGTIQMDVDELWVLYKYLNNVNHYDVGRHPLL